MCRSCKTPRKLHTPAALTGRHYSASLHTTSMKTPRTVGEYLIQQLYAHGARHAFAIPGDYVRGFYDQL